MSWMDDGGSAPSSDDPCPGFRTDGSGDDESTRSDTSATPPKTILRFIERLFEDPAR